MNNDEGKTIALPVKANKMVLDAIMAYHSSRIAARTMTQDELHARCWQSVMAYCWIVEAAQNAALADKVQRADALTTSGTAVDDPVTTGEAAVEARSGGAAFEPQRDAVKEKP